MFNIFKAFLLDLLQNALADLLDPIQSVLSQLISFSLRIELIGESWEVASPITQAVISSSYDFIYRTMCGVMALAFLYKGFKVYIVWRDGDADVSPQSMILGIGSAIIMAVAFPYLYDILCDFILYLGDGLVNRMALSSITLDTGWLDLLTDDSILILLLLLIYIILMLVTFFKLLTRGAELLFLRLGFPLACLSLINSDASLFKQYVGVFFRQAALSIIQMVCLLLSINAAIQLTLLNEIVAITFVLCALSSPKLLAQFLPATGSVGKTSAVLTTVARVALLHA